MGLGVCEGSGGAGVCEGVRGECAGACGVSVRGCAGGARAGGREGCAVAGEGSAG